MFVLWWSWCECKGKNIENVDLKGKNHLPICRTWYNNDIEKIINKPTSDGWSNQKDKGEEKYLSKKKLHYAALKGVRRKGEDKNLDNYSLTYLYWLK